ncbi:plastocyanin/azurin family copper-binding protein [Bradyrhizobium sp. CB82]|uniref:cupredoxin domain-containing protein n=1 Tax=Bradyrhizobium sp. CB82 TaxID=3039159 RepID=UPI0024B24BE5|nr:plastocyanin/azurin family copper-binding protein [Bradyrhizobium sp. CB82]WFU40210.1 plastocyanin/azurin family copper-binding protein [Bradyrhizobium sp. CB82]
MRIHRRAFTQLLASLGVVVTAPAFAEGKTVEVSMKNSPKGMFVPAAVNISVGDTVKWTNPGVITHSVTFDPAQASTASDVALPAGVAPFDSGNMEEDGTFTHTFTVKGTYKYVCKFHEAMGMVGTVVVS